MNVIITYIRYIPEWDIGPPWAPWDRPARPGRPAGPADRQCQSQTGSAAPGRRPAARRSRLSFRKSRKGISCKESPSPAEPGINAAGVPHITGKCSKIRSKIHSKIGPQKLAKIVPKGLQNGGLNGSKITLLGDLPEVCWICYLLYGSHMGLSRGAPGRHPKSGPNPEPLPNPIFPHFGRIWGSIWEPFWHNFCSFSGSNF